MLAWQVTDLIEETARRLAEHRIQSIDAVRSAAVELVGSSETGQRLKRGLERFLHERVYRHHQVLRMTASGDRVLKAFSRNTGIDPNYYRSGTYGDGREPEAISAMRPIRPCRAGN